MMLMEEVRWEAVFPGILASSSTLQCRFPPFSAKSVHPSVNLPIESSIKENTFPRPVARVPYCSLTKSRCASRGLKGTSNTSIAQHLQIDYETVRRWRDRWQAAESRLQVIEETGKRKPLKQAIEVLLTDERRPGAPATFTLEQFMQIMALACETPASADRPVSTWTSRELADEAVKRGIVEQISPRTLERFLKGERFAAPAQAVLAHSASRRPQRTGRADLQSVRGL
jgi:putative transposase